MTLQKYILLSVIIIFIVFFTIFLYAVEKNVHYYYNFGFFKTQQGDYEAAVKAYSMALRQEKNNPEIYMNLAIASFKFVKGLKLKKDNFEKYNKYLNLSIACLKMVDFKIIDYNQGKEITLFSTPYDKTINDIQEKAVILWKKIYFLKNKQDKYSKVKTKIKKKKLQKKLSIKKDKTMQLKKTKVKQQEKTIISSESLKLPKKDLKLVEKILTNTNVSPDDHIVNTLLITNGKINKQNFDHDKELTEMKKKLILLVKEYLGQIGKNDKVQIEKTSKLQKEIDGMKNKIIKLERSYRSQIARLKKKIVDRNMLEEEEEESNKLPEKRKTSNIIFGGSILLTLLLIIII